MTKDLEVYEAAMGRRAEGKATLGDAVIIARGRPGPPAEPLSPNFEPCYCSRCNGKLPAPCRYGTGQGTQDLELEDVRRRLEEVADNFGDDSYGWCWDETRMHLTISKVTGEPVATLHVEYAQ